MTGGALDSLYYIKNVQKCFKTKPDGSRRCDNLDSGDTPARLDQDLVSLNKVVHIPWPRE